jgi:hypothetical protein
MKIFAVILGVILISTFTTVSAHAGGMGGGGMAGGGIGGDGSMGGRMMGNWGTGLENLLQNWQDRKENTISHNEQRKQMQELDQQHNEDSAYLTYQIQMKEKQLDALLESTGPDIEKIKALRKNIRELRLVVDQEQRQYERDAWGLNNDYGSDYRNGQAPYPGHSFN